MRVIISTSSTEFGINDKCASLYEKISGKIFDKDTTKRNDPYLIEAFDMMGGWVSNSYAQLKLVEIPDGVDFVICEKHGKEYIAERHRTWE